MRKGAPGFAALLAVIGISIVFGMILGGKLNAPKVVLAAPSAGLSLPPASAGSSPTVGFADVVERAIPAVVAVTSAQLEPRAEARIEDHPFFSDPYFRRFFGEPEGEGEGTVPRPQPRVGEGSGFIISEDGYILTNNHVVEDSDSVQVTLENGTTYKAEIVGTDPSIDLALIKVDPRGATLPTVALGDSDRLRVGEWVIAIGNPLEFAQTVTVGVVSGKGRRVPLRSTDFAVVSFIQTDAAINFGNSGGPLLDAHGNVVGINTAINRQYLAEGIGFALPVNQARNVVEQLRTRGYVKRGFLGITMNREPIDEAAMGFYALPDPNGVIVSDVRAGGPGERAGLKSGDVIRRVGGEVVADNFDLVSKIASHQPGDKVELQVYRKAPAGAGGQTLELSVTLADRQEGMKDVGGDDRREPVEPDRGPEPEAYETESLGVTVEALSPRDRERLNLGVEQQGLVVTDVEFGSAAASKGVQPGMVITAINDTPVKTVSEWRRMLERLKAGSSVKLDVLVDGQAAFLFLRVEP